MFHSGGAPFAVPALHWRWREWLYAGSLLALGAGIVMDLGIARSQVVDEPPRTVTAPAVTVPAMGKPAVESSGSSQPAAAPAADAKSPRSRDDQRRILMLLLMNSAGSVGPFGGLGR